MFVGAGVNSGSKLAFSPISSLKAYQGGKND
jgi:hypothetical protein